MYPGHHDGYMAERDMAARCYIFLSEWTVQSAKNLILGEIGPQIRLNAAFN